MLGSCYFRATCLPHKGGGVPLSALPKNTTSELAGLFSTTFHKCRAPRREAVDTIYKVVWYGSTRGVNPKSTDCKADALTTTPSRLTVGCSSCHQPSLWRENWASCLSHKVGGVPLSALPKNATSELARLFSTTSPKCPAPSRKLSIPFFKFYSAGPHKIESMHSYINVMITCALTHTHTDIYMFNTNVHNQAHIMPLFKVKSLRRITVNASRNLQLSY